jgi:methionyl-tRNA formyltransferase
MRIIFLGTPEISIQVLKSLINTHDVVAVLTQTDKSVGRSKTPVPSPVANIAVENNIPVFKSEKTDAELIEKLKSFNADIFVTFAYGVILKKDFFGITKLGGVNIHPSLLPKYRGPSPIQSAILTGEKVSGVTIQTIKLKVDSGDILLQKEFDILPGDDAYSIELKVAGMAVKLIEDVLKKIENKTIEFHPQDETKATFCKMIKKEDGLIDWNSNGDEIINKIRAFTKWPVSFCYVDGKKMSIYSAHKNNVIGFEKFKDLENGAIVCTSKKEGLVAKCNDSLINIDVLQMEGKKVLDCQCFLNGCKNFDGKILISGVR